MSRPPPFFDESPRSYLIRLSEANGYPNSQTLIQLLGEVPQYVVTSGWDYGNLKSVLGSTAALPDGFGYRRPEMQVRECAQLMGHEIHTRHLGLKKSRICVQCVKNLGYVPIASDLKAFLACEKHGLMLLKTCPSCGSRIQFRRPGLLICTCGANLGDAEQEVAPTSLTAFGEIIDAVLRRTPENLLQAYDLGMPVEHLLKMDLEVLLKVFVGIANAIKSMSEWRGARRHFSQLVEAIPDAATVLTQWPHRFHGLCKAWQEHPNKHYADNGFRANFNWLFTRLHKNLKERRSQTTFMLEAAMECASRGFDDRPVVLRRREMKGWDATHARYGTATTAGKMLGVNYITVCRWAAQGSLPAKRCGNGGKRKHWSIDLDAVRAEQRKEFTRMSLARGARYLGVSYKSMRAIFDAGFVPNRRRIGTSHVNVATEDLDGLIRSLSDKAVDPQEGLNLVSLKKLLSRTPTIEHPSIVASIRGGKVPVYGPNARDFGQLMVGAPERRKPTKKPGAPRNMDGWATFGDVRIKYHLYAYEASAVFVHLGVRNLERFRRVKIKRVEGFFSKYHLVRKIVSRLEVSALQLIRELRRLRPNVLVTLRNEDRYDQISAFFVRTDVCVRRRHLESRVDPTSLLDVGLKKIPLKARCAVSRCCFSPAVAAAACRCRGPAWWAAWPACRSARRADRCRWPWRWPAGS